MGIKGRIPRPSPALVLAVVALFVALSGTAVAAGVVPLAKRALVADNAKKLQGKTAAQLAALGSNARRLEGKTAQQIETEAAALPSPASTAAGLVSVKSVSFSIPAGAGRLVTATCGSGEKALSGGFTGTLLVQVGSTPTSDGAGWNMLLLNLSDTDAVTGSASVVCLK